MIVQRQLLTLMENLKTQLKLTALLITHDLAVVAETCDRVAVMYGGHLLEQADTLSLYRNPLHPYTQALIGSYPSLKVRKHAMKSIPGRPPAMLYPAPGCRFEPRCPQRMDICRREAPADVKKQGHRVACHRIQ
jgi:oligopeptide/dipeptide ABC transporter ATP-binding protein